MKSKVTVEGYEKLLVFGKNGKMPEDALHTPEEVWKSLKALQ